jgi:hypothetical protein
MLGKLYAKAVTNIEQAFQEVKFTLELVKNYESETSFNEKRSFQALENLLAYNFPVLAR